MFLLIHHLAPGASAEIIPTSMETTAIRYVDTEGDDSVNNCTVSSSPCATIQHAIDVVVAGEEVRVAAGTYNQVQVKSNNQGVTFTQIAYIDKGLALLGGFTTDDWNSADPVNNVTILDPQGHGRGSAMNFKNLLLTNNIGSRVAGDGGAIYLISAREVNIENTQFISNSAISAGGMFVLWQDFPFTIRDSLFQENTANYWGGLGMNDFRTQVTIERTDFISNVSTLEDAGGAYLRPASRNGKLDIDRVRFIGNQAAGNGDAMSINSTTSNTDVEVRLTNLILAQNANPPGITAADDDAVMFVSTRYKTVELSLAHVTAAENALTNFLYVLSNNDIGEFTTVQMTNTLVSGVDYAFAAEEINDGTVKINHANTLFHEIGIDETHTLGGSPSYSGSGAIYGDPLLNSTYHLTLGSAAIDAGIDAGVPYDIDGEARPYGDLPDIGADELSLLFLYLPSITKS